MPNEIKLVIDGKNYLSQTKQSIQKACDEISIVCIGPKLEFCDCRYKDDFIVSDT